MDGMGPFTLDVCTPFIKAEGGAKTIKLVDVTRGLGHKQK